MLLLFPIIEVANATERAVIFHPDSNELREVETDFGAGSSAGSVLTFFANTDSKKMQD